MARMAPENCTSFRLVKACVWPLMLNDPSTAVIMLAVGATDSKIHILTQDRQSHDVAGPSVELAGTSTGPSNFSFAYRQSLSGHADWIRSLHFTESMQLTGSQSSESGYESGDVLLASGSQDTYTRIWRITTALAKTDDVKESQPLDSLDRLMEGEIDAKKYTFMHE